MSRPAQPLEKTNPKSQFHTLYFVCWEEQVVRMSLDHRHKATNDTAQLIM